MKTNYTEELKTVLMTSKNDIIKDWAQQKLDELDFSNKVVTELIETRNLSELESLVELYTELNEMVYGEYHSLETESEWGYLLRDSIIKEYMMNNDYEERIESGDEDEIEELVDEITKYYENEIKDYRGLWSTVEACDVIKLHDKLYGIESDELKDYFRSIKW